MTTSIRARRACLIAMSLTLAAGSATGQTTPRPAPRPAPVAAPAFGLPTATPESVGMSSERIKRLDEIMQRHIDQGDITGAVVAFARRGKLVHYQAYGLSDLEARTPMRKDNIFQMYSSTKVVAAVAVLMMVEEGRIRLEDPVSRYIPEFRGSKVAVRRPGDTAQAYVNRPANAPPPAFDTVPATRDITIRDLMTHTAGLMSSDPRRIGMSPPARARGETLAAYAARVGPTPLDFQPGTRWSYSPTVGPDILAAVVEIVSGQRFDEFLRQRIFLPLGMNDTYFVIPQDKQSRMIPVYRKSQGAWQRVPPGQTTFSGVIDGSNPPSGSMGLVSTARDFLLFQQMLENKGELNGKRILGSRTVELMGTNHVDDLYRGEGGYAKPMYGHGFGMLVQVTTDWVNAENGRSNGAFGWAGYLGTMNWTDPKEELAAVIMLQQNNREVHIDYERAIRQAIID